jgi:hypothetical protein
MKNITIVLVLLCASPALALSVRVHPGAFVYLFEEAPERDLYSVVVQNIAVLNDQANSCVLNSVQLEAVRRGAPVVTLYVNAEELDAAANRTAALSKQGVLKAYDFYFQTSRYLPEDVKFSSSRTLEPGNAILISTRSMLVPGAAEQIKILASCSTSPSISTGSAILKVRKHESLNKYHFPLTGTVYVGAGASLHSHHRWVTNEEFALDVAVLHDNGRTYTGDGTKLAQYASYGADVLAIGDGVVVEARGDVTEADGNLRQPAETIEVYEQRVLAQQNQLLAKGYKEPLGNYVIIRHENGEFSHYAHLKSGSVRVKEGENVKRGQSIGQLGHSGNSTEPHLHFQVTDGQDPMYSRSIPVLFQNVEVEMFGYKNRQLHSGWIVTVQ